MFFARYHNTFWSLPDFDHILLLSDLYPATLNDLLCQLHPKLQFIKLNDKFVRCVFYGLARAIQALHNKDIAHCDIKPSNIALDCILYPRVLDFGLAYSEEINPDQLQKRGTKRFFPPEYTQIDKVRGIKQFKAQDIWALGITLL